MRVLVAVLGAALLCASMSFAQTVTYPARPIRFIVPYPPGGGTDTVARVVARRLADTIGQQVVIDNRGGANAIIGTQIAAKSAADGYTMLLGVPANIVVNPNLYKDLPYDPTRDLTPVAQMTENAYLLTAHMGVPVATVKDLVELARAKPGQLNFGSSGNGSAGHLVLELLKRSAKVDIVHIPYKGGGPALNDLVGGQIQLMGGPMVSALPLVKAGKLKALAVTTGKRISAIPDIPAVGETLPGYHTSGWAGVLVPKGTPAWMIERLNAEIVKAVQNPDVRRQLGEQGSEPVSGTPAAFAGLIVKDMAAYQGLLKAAGMYKGGAAGM
jgi:tripartite-type tricarboxylate transporter receptor subunit TctC